MFIAALFELTYLDISCRAARAPAVSIGRKDSGIGQRRGSCSSGYVSTAHGDKTRSELQTDPHHNQLPRITITMRD